MQVRAGFFAVGICAASAAVMFGGCAARSDHGKPRMEKKGEPVETFTPTPFPTVPPGGTTPMPVPVGSPTKPPTPRPAPKPGQPGGPEITFLGITRADGKPLTLNWVLQHAQDGIGEVLGCVSNQGILSVNCPKPFSSLAGGDYCFAHRPRIEHFQSSSTTYAQRRDETRGCVHEGTNVGHIPRQPHSRNLVVVSKLRVRRPPHPSYLIGHTTASKAGEDLGDEPFQSVEIWIPRRSTDEYTPCGRPSRRMEVVCVHPIGNDLDPGARSDLMKPCCVGVRHRDIRRDRGEPPLLGPLKQDGLKSQVGRRCRISCALSALSEEGRLNVVMCEYYRESKELWE